MKNILCRQLPDWVEISGNCWPIYSDFRDWLSFAELLEDTQLNPSQKAAGMLRWYREDVPTQKEHAIQGLLDFYSMRSTRQDFLHPKGNRSINPSLNETGGREVFDYGYDAGFIYAAFRQCYDINLLTIDSLHWWEFRWLLDALPEECALIKRISLRSIDLSKIRDRRERARIRKLQRAVALPKVLSDQEIGQVFGRDLFE